MATTDRENRVFLIAGILLALAAILFAQKQALLDIWAAWQSDEYSHGLLIPFVALLLGWHRLIEAKPPLRPSWLGFVFIAMGAFLQLVTELSAFGMTAQYGLILEITGLCLAFMGRKATWVVAPALLYLIFAIPLPHLVQATLSQKLQLISSSWGVWPLDLMGVSVYREGNVIDLGGYQLQVVDACSGLRYLFPLMSFGYLIAFLMKDKIWKRWVIFLSTIPITIGLNALRITIIGLTVNKWGIEMAEGFIHAFEGWSVFIVCLFILMLEIMLLQHIGSRGSFNFDYMSLPRGTVFGATINRKTPAIAALLMSMFLAGLFGTGYIRQWPEIIPSHKPLSSFPLTLGEWQGRQDNITSEVLQVLKLSDYWIANYQKAEDSNPVNLYIAYYASQRVGVTTHSPSNCIPGGGWEIEKSRVEAVPLANGKNLKLTRLIVRRGNEGQLVYYWFDERGRELTETYSAKWYLLWDSMIMHRTDGALIRLVTPISRGEDEATAERRMHDFIAVAYPEIKAFIPGPTLNPVAVP
ncbi:MAG: VPLPA-CTERM-specific exosortase XrtD [Alphaproteobacteria bacterium]